MREWRCKSGGVRVWRCEGVREWRCESVGVRVWRCEGVDV